MGCVGDCNAGKGLEKEVRVCAFGVVESVLAMLDEHVQIVIGYCRIFLEIIQGLEFLDSQAGDIGIEDLLNLWSASNALKSD